MRQATIPLALAAAACAAAPAGAARPAQPLVDVAPQAYGFRDHVGPSTRAASRAQGDSPPVAYSAPDGQSVRVRFSRSYTPDPEIAQTYVDFLGGLPHGTELGRLRIYIATPKEVQSACGGVDGTLACYDPSVSRMTVPGEQTADDGSGITTSYVIAHEYGHHISRHRTNKPFSALNFGPKYWASLEQVCIHTINGRLAPGDEGENYLSNPGEAWADTFAHLTYPDVSWQFTPLLRPTAKSKRAARQDVLAPWTRNATKVFHGRFAPGGRDTQIFSFVLTLDGSLRIALDGPRRANFDVDVESLGRDHGGTEGPTSDETYFVRYACREADSENVLVKVRRRHGFGAFTATVTYAG
jgi:hypothetical protein